MFMSYQEKGFFIFLEQVDESSFKIQENVPKSVEELIEIDQSGPAKTKNGKPLILLKTTQGRLCKPRRMAKKHFYGNSTTLKNFV